MKRALFPVVKLFIHSSFDRDLGYKAFLKSLFINDAWLLLLKNVPVLVIEEDLWLQVKDVSKRYLENEKGY